MVCGLSVLVPPEPRISYWLSEMAAILHPVACKTGFFRYKQGIGEACEKTRMETWIPASHWCGPQKLHPANWNHWEIEVLSGIRSQGITIHAMLRRLIFRGQPKPCWLVQP
jgi:hypothetical protein